MTEFDAIDKAMYEYERAFDVTHRSREWQAVRILLITLFRAGRDPVDAVRAVTIMLSPRVTPDVRTFSD